MIIENIDALKVWLIKTLEPICDADPVALAKYVVALAKKDKPQPELKALCEDQLDVFLGDETKEFVTELFNTLVSKSYMVLTPQKKTELTVKNNEEVEQKGTKRKSFEEVGKSEKLSESDKIQKTESRIDVGKVKIVESDKENVNQKKSDRIKDGDNDRKKDNDYDDSTDLGNQPKLSEKFDKDKPLRMSTRQSIREENKFKQDIDNISMRSLSQDRSVKSVSPVAMKTRHGHSSRRKSSRSPSRSTRHTRSSRRDRTRREHHDRNRDKRNSGRREKEKCRDYEEKGFCMLGEVCPYDHGYDPVEVDDRNLPQMLTLAGIPAASQANAQIPGAPLQIIPNVLPARPLVPLSSALSLNTGLTTVQVQNTRPIPSPAELPNHQVPIFRPRNPLAFMRNLSPTAVTPISQQIIRPVSAPTVQAAKTTDDLPKPPNTAYNPEDPSIEEGVANTLKVAMKTQSLPSVVDTNVEKGKGDKVMVESSIAEDKNKIQDEDNRTQDELVQIAMGNVPLTPIVGSQRNNMWNGDTVSSSHPQQLQTSVSQQMQNSVLPVLQPAYLPMTLTVQQQYHQLQIQQHQAALASQQHLQNVANAPPASFKPYRKNCILELRKIPAELNNILRLSEFFQKFGNVTKVQTPYDNDPQAALLEFSSYIEATAAYSCPEAILGNRFIKMFWHNPNRSKTPTVSTAPAVKQVNTNATSQESSHPVDAGRPRKIALSGELTYRNPKADPKMMQIEKMKEVEKFKIELIKTKQNHYEELAKRQKEILSKLQSSGLTKEEKERLKKAFKHADVACQKLKKELLEHTQVNRVVADPLMKAADAKKAILDKEIDIYHGNLSGEELIEAKRSLAILKREANFGKPAPRGRGGYRGRGRGSWYRGSARGNFHSSNIDNRPKQIIVSGYDVEEKDDVVAHFVSFAQVDRIEEHENNKMILTFPTRKSADIAAQQGRDFKGKSLILSWFTGERKADALPQPPRVERQMTRTLSQSLMDKDLDDDLLELDKEEEEMLLADVEDDDDEDDMESEDRSWRR